MTKARPTRSAAGSVSAARSAQDEGPAARPALTPAMRRPIGVMAIVGLLLLAVPAPFYAGESEPGRFDRWVQSPLDGTLPRRAGLTVDWIGEPIGRTLAMVALATVCLVLGRRRLAAVAIAGTVLTSLATTALKPVVDRTIHGEFLSYPSGHTAAAVALGLILALLLVDLLRTGWLAGTLVVLALAVTTGAVTAWAQITLGAHYPTDTVGGFATAMAVVPATAWLVDRIADARRVE